MDFNKQMQTKTPIPLFYWSSKRFENKPRENYGDLLSKYLVEKISGRTVKWVHPKKQLWYKWNKKNYFAVGSILAHATKESIVWGSGIIDRKHNIAKADFRAVRGPYTREFLLKQGIECPEVYGDPALLLPLFFKPVVKKRYKLGVVPHYVDFTIAKEFYANQPEVKVIDLLTDDIASTTKEILTCEKIISSSLHGIIIAHAYDIPVSWVKFSDKIFGDEIKYIDYFESVGVSHKGIPQEIFKEKSQETVLFNFESIKPDSEQIRELQLGLLKTCPFKSGVCLPV